MIAGRFTDGRSAASREVNVTIESEWLSIVGAGVSELWPFARIRVLEQPGRLRIVLALKPDGEARLTLPESARAALSAAAPKLFDLGAVRRRTALGAGLLVAASAGLAALIFLGLPALSSPLAHMVPPDVEKRIGGQTDRYLGLFTDSCPTPAAVQDSLDRVAAKLEAVSRSALILEIRLVDASFPNALALPGGRIYVTDELVAIMENPNELVGVLAHETAHVAERHAMAAILRSVGYGLLLDVVLGGGSGAGQQIALAASQLEGLRHTRNAEAEADAKALAYLQEAGYDTTGLAQFFERLEEYFKDENNDKIAYPELLSTHPNTGARAISARDKAGPSRGAAFSTEEWSAIKAACAGANRWSKDKAEPAVDLEEAAPAQNNRLEAIRRANAPR